eukprot:157484-Rhodomonas_salina.2
MSGRKSCPQLPIFWYKSASRQYIVGIPTGYPGSFHEFKSTVLFLTLIRCRLIYKVHVTSSGPNGGQIRQLVCGFFAPCKQPQAPRVLPPNAKSSSSKSTQVFRETRHKK